MEAIKKRAGRKSIRKGERKVGGKAVGTARGKTGEKAWAIAEGSRRKISGKIRKKTGGKLEEIQKKQRLNSWTKSRPIQIHATSDCY